MPVFKYYGYFTLCAWPQRYLAYFELLNNVWSFNISEISQ